MTDPLVAEDVRFPPCTRLQRPEQRRQEKAGGRRTLSVTCVVS